MLTFVCVVSLQDNVVCLSPRLAQSLGNMGQVCVCIRVTSSIHLIDPNTLQSEEHLTTPKHYMLRCFSLQSKILS